MDESENSLKEVRNQLAETENMHVNSSGTCDRCASGCVGNVAISSPESMSQVSFQAIVKKLDYITQSINEKIVNQTVLLDKGMDLASLRTKSQKELALLRTIRSEGNWLRKQ